VEVAGRVHGERRAAHARGSLAAVEESQMVHLDPTLVQFLQRREPSGWWARYTHRRQRVKDVLHTLQHLETL
jgi:hypothetical protein